MSAIIPHRQVHVETGPSRMPVHARDNEFLPAALEILETPPSPVRLAFLLIICAFATTALVWSYVGRIDIVAAAPGKIQPTGRVKLIQPLDTGKVKTLYVSNGTQVRAGQTLVELDPAATEADEATLAVSLASYKAEIIRRRTALQAVRAKNLTPPIIPWNSGIPANLQERESLVMAGDMEQLASAVAGLLSQQKQKRAELARLKDTMIVQQKLIATLKERVDLRTILLVKNSGTRTAVMDATETLQYQQTVLANQVGQAAESEASIEVLTREITKTYDKFISDYGQKLADVSRQADDTEKKLAKAKVATERMILTSPIDGTVQALGVTTLGQVVSTSEVLMRIVPQGNAFEIECYLPNKDIGFVKQGQIASVKIDSFPFTRYGTLNAKVIRIATDAIPEPDVQQSESNPGRAPRATMFSGAERTQNLVFPVTLQADAAAMKIDGVAVPLSAGMAVTVEIRTGDRRILEYIFSPLVQIASESMKER